MYEKFPTREACLIHLEKQRWKGKPKCPYCSSSNFTHLKNGSRYHCNLCNTKYSVTVKTLFHRTRVDLQKWFLAIYLLIYARTKLSSRQLAKLLAVDKNTAWLMIARIDFSFS
ncbi:transposase [Nostoc piscinale]|uniref:transposase n=1 Tax=Nostoc piscinale TaxID=224012 RepID=UPI0009FB3268